MIFLNIYIPTYGYIRSPQPRLTQPPVYSRVNLKPSNVNHVLYPRPKPMSPVVQQKPIIKILRRRPNPTPCGVSTCKPGYFMPRPNSPVAPPRIKIRRPHIGMSPSSHAKLFNNSKHRHSIHTFLKSNDISNVMVKLPGSRRKLPPPDISSSLSNHHASSSNTLKKKDTIYHFLKSKNYSNVLVRIPGARRRPPSDGSSYKHASPFDNSKKHSYTFLGSSNTSDVRVNIQRSKTIPPPIDISKLEPQYIPGRYKIPKQHISQDINRTCKPRPKPKTSIPPGEVSVPEFIESVTNISEGSVEPISEIDYSVEYEDYDTHGKGLAPEHAISVNNIPDNGIEPLTEIDYSVEYEDAPNITYGKIMPESIVTATNISEGLIAPQSVIDYSVEYEDDSPNGETSTDC
ncbi:unnamed protein product [Gordionus sp. m RMFG-2023]